MKKLFSLLCAGLMVFTLVGVALADVDVTTTVDTTKTATVDTNIDITKTVLLNAKQLAPITTSAEADVTKNDANYGNVVLELPSQVEPMTLPGETTTSNATISGTAFQNATGIISVNQAPGNANNQGNAVAVAYVGLNEDASFLHAGTHIDKTIGVAPDDFAPIDAGALIENIAAAFGLDITVADLTGAVNVVASLATSRQDELTDNAFGSAVGVISVNQASGNINNQNNGTSAAFGGSPTYTLAESDLGLVTANNVIVEVDVDKTDTINLGAFASAAGIISVNQASGNCNNQANTVAITAASFGGPF